MVDDLRAALTWTQGAVGELSRSTASEPGYVTTATGQQAVKRIAVSLKSSTDAIKGLRGAPGVDTEALDQVLAGFKDVFRRFKEIREERPPDGVKTAASTSTSTSTSTTTATTTTTKTSAAVHATVIGSSTSGSPVVSSSSVQPRSAPRAHSAASVTPASPPPAQQRQLSASSTPVRHTMSPPSTSPPPSTTMRAPRTVVGPEKDLWKLAVSLRNKASGAPIDAPQEYSLVFVGAKNSGKSTLVSHFLEKDCPKEPTIALKYTYGQRSKPNSVSKDIIHCWELAGGSALAALLEVCITPQSVINSVLVLTVKLSEPEFLLSTIREWMTHIQTRTSYCLQHATQMGWQIQNPVAPSPESTKPVKIPVLLACTHFDACSKFNPHQVKVISRTLRNIAHDYGLAIMFLNTSDSKMILKYRAVIHYYLFGSSNASVDIMKLSDCGEPDAKHKSTGCVLLPIGADTFESIGRPPPSSSGGSSTWQDLFEKLFPPGQEPTEQESVDKADLWREPMIDSLRADKEKAFERYQRELARAKAEIASVQKS
ncbi:cytoplasmic dynein 2 light intermediate chain 1 [Pelomyxa schiedti]|nr:cytoplasmic dynein 2 light intermediate chain 1 [Pelomyxa schiedti]